MKTGLVLEGGGMRGLFTAGVIDVLMENGIMFDGLIGVSAGAVFGCNYKSGQIGRVLRYNTAYCGDPRYCSLRSLIKTGDLFGKDFCYRELPEELDIFDKEAFAKNPMEFYVTCTDVMSGEPVYKRLDKVDETCYEWMRASASMPLVSTVVEIDGQKLLDGGISDSVPLKFFESLGFDRNVVVLTQPYGYSKKKNLLAPLMKLTMKNYPGMVNAMMRRHQMYNHTTGYISEKESEGKIIVIRPETPLPVGRTEKNPEKLREAYNLGRKAAEEELQKIEFFLEKKDII